MISQVNNILFLEIHLNNMIFYINIEVDPLKIKSY